MAIRQDRKSTRLNSSHRTISYAVFCLKKKIPLYWLVVTSLKSKRELFASTVHLVPHNPTLAAYSSVLFERGFIVLLKNIVVVCACAVAITLAVGLLITYPITRLPLPARLRVGILNWALSLRFLPPIAVVIPYFLIVRTAQIYDQ